MAGIAWKHVSSELSQLFEGVYRGAADLRAPIVLPLTPSCQKGKRRGNAKGFHASNGSPAQSLRHVEIPYREARPRPKRSQVYRSASRGQMPTLGHTETTSPKGGGSPKRRGEMRTLAVVCSAEARSRLLGVPSACS